eukprot:1972189-Rhodomonas_salina.1
MARKGPSAGCQAAAALPTLPRGKQVEAGGHGGGGEGRYESALAAAHCRRPRALGRERAGRERVARGERGEQEQRE